MGASHSVSVAGVVVSADGRVLVIRRRDNGAWEPPGGVLELDESPEGGVVREVWEETGVGVRVERLTGVYKNMARGIIALVFRCTPTTGEPQTSPESSAVEWFTPQQVTQRMSEAYAIRVLDALSTQTPQVRTHDGHHLTHP
ncbi:NUDIX domain-containing protein [Spiractinospora alimapuensis]|uniref:NUDIX domain-containing protein n=1 Tax=Spiractinospora alimapuensis TaxID=2820884 RepID=UPI0022AA93FD|nr:NUDIX domain-containing protein [Spiractinospora alimapuensis]QVQ54390.1 NUDIX domain-containing protein [Spiractinospora alimapuensis]